MKLYQVIAQTAGAYHRCVENVNSLWEEKYRETLEHIEKEWLPSGSGIDSGTKIVLDWTNDDKIVLTTAYHHMNDGGFYDGWTEHKIVVTPAFQGFNIRVGGRDRNGIKDYLADVFRCCLEEEYVEVVSNK